MQFTVEKINHYHIPNRDHILKRMVMDRALEKRLAEKYKEKETSRSIVPEMVAVFLIGMTFGAALVLAYSTTI